MSADVPTRATVPRQFRTKSVVVEVMHWLGDRDALAAFMGEHHRWEINDHDWAVFIPTTSDPYGHVVWARLGDWIVKEPRGHFATCPADVFWQTYDPIDVT